MVEWATGDYYYVASKWVSDWWQLNIELNEWVSEWLTDEYWVMSKWVSKRATNK